MPIKNQLMKDPSAEGKNKKWTKNKIIAVSILGAALLSFIVFTVIVLCMNLGPVRPIKSTKAEALTVGDVGGYEVKYEELRYVTLLHRTSLDNELGKYDTLNGTQREKYENELKERVLKDIENNYVILTLCDKYGIKTDSIELDRLVQDEIELLVANDFGGEFEKYKAWLEANNLTDSFVRLIYKVNTLESRLLAHIVENKIGIEYDEESLNAFVTYVMESDDWVRTIHSFYPKKSDVFDTSASHDKAQEAAERLAAIKDGEERYDEMCSVIASAPFVVGYSITGNGIYFTHGQMGEIYESAGFGLDIYETSGVVEADEGYYVIMRMPLEREHIDYARAIELLGYYQYGVLKGYEDAQRELIEFTPNEKYANIVLSEIK